MSIRIEVAYNKFTDKLYLVSDGMVSSEFVVEKLPANLHMFRKLLRTHIHNLTPRESKPVAIEVFIGGEVIV